MSIFFIVYTAIVVLAAISLHINYRLQSKKPFDQVIRLFLSVLIVHVVHAALFRDVFVHLTYVDRGAPFGWIYGPLLYFAFRSSRGTLMKGRAVIHVIPFLIGIPMYVYFLSSEAFRLQHGRLYYSVLYGFMTLSWLGYSLYVLIQGTKKKSNGVNRDAGLTLLAVLILVTLTVFMLSFVFNYTFKGLPTKSKTGGFFIYFAMLASVVMVYWHHFQRLVSRAAHIDRKEPPESSTVPVKTSLDTLLIEQYIPQVQAYMVPENYLDPSLSLDKAARDLRIPRHQLSQIFNQHFGKNFSRYVSSLRVDYACALLIRETLPNIEAMAEQCGFKSRASFYRNFNQEKGCSPLEYREAYFLEVR